MTIEEIKTVDKAMLRPTDIAPIIGCDPQWVRDTARENPAALGFPVLVVGTRVKIPRVPFLKFLGYAGEEATV